MNGLTHSIQRRGDEVRLALTGEADLSERDHLSTVLNNALAGLQATPTRLTVDAAALTFMDCSIIGLLTTTAAGCRPPAVTWRSSTRAASCYASSPSPASSTPCT